MRRGDTGPLDNLLAGRGATSGTRGGGLARANLDPSFYLASTRKGEATLKVTDFVSSAGVEPAEIDIGGGVLLKLTGQRPNISWRM